MNIDRIRNFVIIAHVDHGKSTLADRFLELTGAIEKRKMRAQYLDQMDLEREKGITIKMQPVQMRWRPAHAEIRNQKSPPAPKLPPTLKLWRTGRRAGKILNTVEIRNSKFELTDSEFILNLIDTPGHADFAYEVSRSLAAVEGAILLVDATQGVQAQTIANLHLARAEGLRIIPAINKIDLLQAQVLGTKSELARLLDIPEEEVFSISAKDGTGVSELLTAIVEKIPPPVEENLNGPLRALIFDSHFDVHRGVVAHVRVVDGNVRVGDMAHFLQSGARREVMEVGHFFPEMRREHELAAGDIGYLTTGIKTPAEVRVGDTITESKVHPASSGTKFKIDIEPLPGYREPTPMVWATLWPTDADAYERLREALEKLKLNDAAITFFPERSSALGRGFRLGSLGMLHLEITAERLRREYELEAVISRPSVVVRTRMPGENPKEIASPRDFPTNQYSGSIEEPWVKLAIIIPQRFLGPVVELVKEARGNFVAMNPLSADRIEVIAEAPLSEIISDFYDHLKSRTQGYGSFAYEAVGFRPADLVKLEVLVAGREEEALAQIVPRQEVLREGRRVVLKLKEHLTRQLFPVAIQAAAEGRVIARETLAALKKNVTGYLYGGDRTRKMKLWKKQQRGKKRLTEMGHVQIPPAVFLELLKK